jgi:hypothetical protein
MTKVPQTNADLICHLKNQYEFLKTSARSFDAGFTNEAQRLALTIRILVHNTNNSHSLLKQLQSQDKMSFLNTSEDFEPDNTMPTVTLAAICAQEYQAFCDAYKYFHEDIWKMFDPWWNQIIIVDKNKNQFTRKSIILAIADTDGGAHIDPSLNEQYANLSKFNSIGWQHVEEGKTYDFLNGPELASVRQIAYELIRSIEKYYVNEIGLNNMMEEIKPTFDMVVNIKHFPDVR